MLETVRYIEVEGKKIIKHFGQLMSDPVATNVKADYLASQTEYPKKIKEAEEEIQEIIKVNPHSFFITDEYKAALTKLYTLGDRFKKTYRQLRIDNEIHFEPRANEIILDPAEIQKLKALVKEHAGNNKLITVEGEVINVKENQTG